MSFQFHSLKNGLPSTKSELHQLAFFAHAQFIAEGGEVTVGKPAIAVGSELSRIKRTMIRRGN